MFLRHSISRVSRGRVGALRLRGFSSTNFDQFVVHPDKDGGLSSAKVQRAVSCIKDHGFVILPGLLEQAVVASLREDLSSVSGRVFDRLREINHNIGIGSKRGFHELVQRSPGRWDVPVDTEIFTRSDTLGSFTPVVEGVMGTDIEPVFCGAVNADPETCEQMWHVDSCHESPEHKPCHLMNGLIAMHDIPMEMGPTELSAGTHKLTNHLAYPWLDPSRIPYQFEDNCPSALASDQPPTNVQMAMPAGSVLLFDDRIYHRGGANKSKAPREVAYFSFRKIGFQESTHFEAIRSIFDPEAEGKTKTDVSTSDCLDIGKKVKGEFPGLTAHADAVFVDGASGSQVHSSVIASVAEMMRLGAANIGGYYPTSERVLSVTERARAAAGDLLNCTAEEVTFGNNMTTLTFHLASALEHSELLQSGNNIVLSRLEHDANVAPWLRVAEQAGAEVRWVPVLPDGTLDMAAFHRAVDSNTAFVAMGYACNSLGTINDVRGACAAAKAVGALSFVDAVHYAPHGLLNVKEVGCDFLAVSPYKFFGPHCGVLYGKSEVMQTLVAPKIRTATDSLPSSETWQLSRWELGTQNSEALAGFETCVDYIASLGERFGGCDASASRRDRLAAGWSAVAAHEDRLKEHFLRGLANEGLERVRVHGICDPDKRKSRTATFAITMHDPSSSSTDFGPAGTRDPDEVTQALCKAGVYCTASNHYNTFWKDALNLSNDHGATRMGFMHYNTLDDVNRVLATLRDVSNALP